MAEFRRSIAELLETLPKSRLIYLPSPGVVEERLTGPGDRTNELIRQYTDAAGELFAVRGGPVLQSAEAQADYFEDDGVHLNSRGYALPPRRVLVLHLSIWMRRAY